MHFIESYKICNCSKAMQQQLLTPDENVLFYTGILNINTFSKLHEYISKFVMRKWRGPTYTSMKIERKFKNSPKKIGAKPKLNTKVEFLSMLMKLRLGLLNVDLANRFSISPTLCSRIIATWVKAAAAVLKALVYVPNQGVISATKPPRFLKLNEIHSILDATEIFIQTPKNHAVQRMTWSSYKHHNTAKVLICILPNSLICFASLAYTGSISDKAITIDCGYLDLVEPYSSIMVDKGFNIVEECAARRINVIVPPGKRGQGQMLPIDVKKTNNVAKLRILVEQVISRFKNFRIIGNEVPINMLCHLDDIITICAALTNLRKPIYSN